MTAVANGPLEPGDLVTTTCVGEVYGRVFDVIGDVHRVWWGDAVAPNAVESLSPHTAGELQLVQRPVWYLAVWFTGDDDVDPYAFVVADERPLKYVDAEHAFDRAENYEIVSRRLGHTPTGEDANPDTMTDEDNDDAGDERTTG